MIIVTGGAGFIGSAFVAKLNEMGINDIVIVDSLKESDKWKNLVGKKYIDYVNKNEFFEFIEDYKEAEAVIHMGACSTTTERNADYLMKNNFQFSQALADWALANDMRFIYASSASTYGDGSLGFSDNDELVEKLRPMHMYGYSKQLIDEWVLRENLQDRVVGLKFFNVFGPNEYHKTGQFSVVNTAFHQIQETGKMKLFKSNHPDYKDGEQMRDFVYVKDIVDVMWWLLKNDDVNGIFNLGTGKARNWNDLVKAVFTAMEIPTNIEFIPMPDKLKKQYQNYTQADMKKLQDAGCPIKFRTLEDSVKDYVQNYLMQENPYL